ncbi:MAG: prolipoprotein diacylglyceryl transferase [Oscillospiraceae bacterium]|jgi:phosphatidylglycerol:prolipoprotein diacylglycerol transferase|nr:prolipoprotein diacylglyceryl transferase [Oscillospiraceae bacterium]
MTDNPIVFPGLGLQFDPSPVAFTIFGRGIYWYGIIIAASFLLAAYYTVRRAPRVGIRQDDFIDALLFAVPVAIIFSRLYYVVFNFREFVYDPVKNPYPQKIYEIWKGGIAIYGAIIGAVLTAYIFCRVKKLRFSALMDVAALGLLIGQCIGRWGNFINREAHGTRTNLPWGMEVFVNRIGDEIINNRITVHPTFLYESLWTLLGFLLLHRVLTRRKFTGQVFLMYVAWYGLGRGLIEGLRTDSLYFFNTSLRISQVLGFVSCAAAVALLIYNWRFRTHDPATLAPLSEGAEPGAAAGAEPAPEIEEAEEVTLNVVGPEAEAAVLEAAVESAESGPSDDAGETTEKAEEAKETEAEPRPAPEEETL